MRKAKRLAMGGSHAVEPSARGAYVVRVQEDN
jgi:hypothetical protein